jgi:hypothetical protein
LFVEKDGSIQTKKITVGAQSLIATLLQETALRIFQEEIDAGAIMPNGLYPVWPVSDPIVRLSDLYQHCLIPHFGNFNSGKPELLKIPCFVH